MGWVCLFFMGLVTLVFGWALGRVAGWEGRGGWGGALVSSFCVSDDVFRCFVGFLCVCVWDLVVSMGWGAGGWLGGDQRASSFMAGELFFWRRALFCRVLRLGAGCGQGRAVSGA